MKKPMKKILYPLCAFMLLIPLFAASVGAHAEEAELVETFIQLDAATATDAGKTQDASMTDIVLDLSQGPKVLMNESAVSDGKITYEEGKLITFKVENAQPCILFYESGSTGLVAVNSDKVSDSVYSYSMPAWLSLYVYLRVKGDTDDSGIMDLDDISAVKEMILSDSQPSGLKLLYTDSNNDGVIDTKDLTALKAHIYGIRSMSW